MATATFGPQGKTRALDSIIVGRGGYKINLLIMNTIPTLASAPADPQMIRQIDWGLYGGYARSTNKLTPKEEITGRDEFDDGLLFPIAANRKFSNMTLCLADSMYPEMLIFELDGGNTSRTSGSYGTAKLVGEIRINF